MQAEHDAIFTPANLFHRHSDAGHQLPNVGLVILNQPLLDLDRFRLVWRLSRYRVCADGAANRLHDFLSRYGEEIRNEYSPNAIVGDLDSIRDDIKQFYAERLGVKIVEDRDQYSTDFQKSVRNLAKWMEEHHDERSETAQGANIIILGSLGGRVDQGIGLIHELYRESCRTEAIQSNLRFWFISESSVSFILGPGDNIITGVHAKNGVFSKYAGILPVYGPAVITIRGFEWDVTDWRTEMGGMVSTSNHIQEDEISIKTDRHVLFTIALAESS